MLQCGAHEQQFCVGVGFGIGIGIGIGNGIFDTHTHTGTDIDVDSTNLLVTVGCSTCNAFAHPFPSHSFLLGTHSRSVSGAKRKVATPATDADARRAAEMGTPAA